MYALTRSLRWRLRIRLLQEAGVPDTVLGEAVSASIFD
jgi:hypothetical protein